MKQNNTSVNKQSLGYWQLLSISLGQVVGAGIVVLTGIGISITGYGVPWAFVVALFIVFLPSLCIAALGSALPSTGGTYTYVRDLIGNKTGFFYLALLVAGQLVLATYALGFADYAAELFPEINIRVIAAFAMISCYIANLLGIQTAAKVQLVLVSILIVSLVAFVAVGYFYIDSFEPYTNIDKVMPAGFASFIGAAYILRYGMVGSEFVSELGGESKNPGKHIPMVMITCLLLVTLLYFGIALVATGVMPLEIVRGQSLAFIAKEIFPPSMYLFFVIGGVMLALISSLNAIFSWCTKGLYIAAHDGWLPLTLARTNRFGTPYILLSVFFVVGMLPIVTGTTLEYVTILGNAVGIVFGIIPALALYNLNTRKPEEYQQASFKLPIWAMKTLPIVALIIYAYGVYLSSLDYIKIEHVFTFILYALITIIYAKWREPMVIETRIAKS